MKVIPIARQTYYATGSTTDAYGFRVERGDGQVYGFTSGDTDTEFDGVTYSATPGLNVSEIVQQASLAVDNLKLSTLNDGSVFTKSDIMAGVWRNAKFELFKYNWDGESDGTEPIMSGVFGQPQISRSMVEVELRDLKQYHQQTVGAPSVITCRNRFAHFDSLTSWCQLELSDYTFAGTVLAVTDNGEFLADLIDVDDYFGNSEFLWVSGNNAGLPAIVKTYSATTDGGTFVLDLPMFRTVQVGDTFTVIAGCRKRLTEDCVTKFDNAVDFNGEPHRPTLNSVIQAPTPSV